MTARDWVDACADVAKGLARTQADLIRDAFTPAEAATLDDLEGERPYGEPPTKTATGVDAQAQS